MSSHCEQCFGLIFFVCFLSSLSFDRISPHFIFRVFIFSDFSLALGFSRSHLEFMKLKSLPLVELPIGNFVL